MDLSRKFGKEIPSQNLREKRSDKDSLNKGSLNKDKAAKATNGSNAFD